MRILVLSIVIALGCRGSAPPGAETIYKYLPANPDVAVRLDLVRLRASPLYAKVAPAALRKAQKLLDAAKTACNLDVIAETKTLVIAKRGSLADGDLTLIGTGLAKDKVLSCLATLQKSDSQQLLTVDGDLFHVAAGGKSLGSGAVLPSGEVVFVIRNGGGVEPAAWKQELAAPRGSRPDWWGEMNATDPVALRVAGDGKHGAFSITLGDPLLARGSVVAASAQAAQNDLKTYQAIVDYLKQSDTGTVRLEVSGETIFADLTATGPQIERLITMALPALFPPEQAVEPEAPLPPGVTVECASLAGAVEQYLKQGLSLASSSQKAEMERVIPTLLPRLQKAFVDRCTADSWSPASIRCHLTSATQLPRFEKCRNALTSDQRDKLDKAITEAMSPASGTP